MFLTNCIYIMTKKRNFIFYICKLYLLQNIQKCIIKDYSQTIIYIFTLFISYEDCNSQQKVYKLRNLQ